MTGPFAIIDMVQRVVFNEMKLRKNRGFKEFWVIHFSPEELPARRQRA
jgi:hypothetical protein